MKKWTMLMSVITLVVVLAVVGCQGRQSTKEEVYEDFQKKITKMSAYKCIAEVQVIGNKSPGNYIFIHNYSKPDKYKLEIIAPERLKGKTIEYNKDKILIKNPSIKDEVELPNISPNNQYMFIGDFISNYLNNEELSVKMKDQYLQLEVPIPGENEYFAKEILYVNAKTKNPEKLEILDMSNELRFTITYKNFEYKN